ncbi:hypothetical protein A3D66_01410 [Candidatus Kaiserbacteria bacterium RIFCSPHIGHO2_02_FULL_50_9]|uniref:Peptidase A24A N-terminal domain-containing protein n=1 Tax=Candidatus Kaiserbacteria bacterium RIFCSPLOWO2_01_FULL_51_21 TaxID=1798508 RepID=A0A1F6ECS7_9BACT|nr:MAG: hypothetical protein A2761_00990 [Candidatus Kaiserbacteria bacterium RIFCSPHIGHO2_01_FULL_51_33]OGG63302.1 MAG: hypothetical protein A3D66_01410 [Candidatus Kaiserbacteria bacterium RIFCSPHIGHO2_02_FULL_50_9]OGG71456.1 MAG: hypothetical protein A3A35_03360 [Candidatus Kaiserbacteria bacterium RIFCSPLOWO2_01_FULL_51_21]
MYIALGIFLFCLGACIGSFLNVVVLRYNTGRSLSGRSGCFSCGHTLGFFDLVPVLSFLFSSGRCRYCNSSISLQYPLVESAVGVLFLVLYLKGFPFLLGIYLAVIFSLLTVILVYDIRHKIIPDPFVYAFIALSALSLGIDFDTVTVSTPTLWHALAGPVLFMPFFILWFVSKGTWLGLGDGKLAWGVGWLLGLSGGTTALLIGVWIGAVLSIALLLGQSWLFRGGKRLTMKSEMPFAPFMILGLVLVLFLDINFYSLLSIFSF